MSEKTRRKKDRGDANKKNQRMKEVNKDADKKNVATSRQDKAGRGQGKSQGRVKAAHRIDSVRSGFGSPGSGSVE